MITEADLQYATLLAKTLPAVIHSEKENERYTSLLDELDRKGSKLSTAEQRLADLLTLLIEDFEERHYALKPATPIAALEELMAANDLQQKDLLDIFSTSQHHLRSPKRQTQAHHRTHSQTQPKILRLPRTFLLVF
jgi:antitoxin component HigA of HigAB toxin-antitoxin module